MIHSSAVIVTLALLTIARLTRFINADTLTDPARAWVGRKMPGGIVYLVQCAWCVSIYVGAAVAVPVYLWPWSWWVQVPLIMFAGSYIAGFGAQAVAALEVEK